jgi:uncharacterized RDD family membrane protein YckC
MTDTVLSQPLTLSQLPSAGLACRFAAMIYDALLLMAISIGYFALAVLVNVLLQGAPAEGQKVQWGQWDLLVFASWLLVLGYFFCFFWQRSGQTLGMRAWRLQLINEEGRAPSWGQCVVRCLLAPFALGFLGLGYFWRWLDPHKLTLHDRLSKTRVVILPKAD